MRGRQIPGGINAPVAAKAEPRKVQNREYWRGNGKQESPAAQRALPLEIVEVDSLREFLGCACARQERPVLVSERHDGVNRAKQN